MITFLYVWKSAKKHFQSQIFSSLAILLFNVLCNTFFFGSFNENSVEKCKGKKSIPFSQWTRMEYRQRKLFGMNYCSDIWFLHTTGLLRHQGSQKKFKKAKKKFEGLTQILLHMIHIRRKNYINLKFWVWDFGFGLQIFFWLFKFFWDSGCLRSPGVCKNHVSEQYFMPNSFHGRYSISVHCEFSPCQIRLIIIWFRYRSLAWF